MGKEELDQWFFFHRKPWEPPKCSFSFLFFFWEIHVCDPFLSPGEEILEPQNSLFDRGTSEFFPLREVTSFSGNECVPDGYYKLQINVNPFYGLILAEFFSWLHAKCFNAHYNLPETSYFFPCSSRVLATPRFPLWGKRRRRRLNFDRTVLLPWENDVSRRRVLMMIQLPPRGPGKKSFPRPGATTKAKQPHTCAPTYIPRSYSTCPEKRKKEKNWDIYFYCSGETVGGQGENVRIDPFLPLSFFEKMNLREREWVTSGTFLS